MVRENIKNYVKIALIVLLMAISIGLISYSFGWNGDNNRLVSSNNFEVSQIDFGLTTDVGSVSLGEVLPTLDKFGLMNESFTFTVSNTTEKEKDYIIKLVDGREFSTIPNNSIRYQLVINDEVMGIYNLDEDGIIDSGVLMGHARKKYSIKIWLDYNSDAQDGVWDKGILVLDNNGNLDKSGANLPSLDSNMIPVYYDETDEVWRKADSSNTNKNYQWYDYDNQVWANAVTVSETNRVYYIETPPGTKINMEDINSMWVWIPRYKYTIFNSDSSEDKEKKINITFESGVNSTGTIICSNEFTEGLSEVCKDKTNGYISDGVSTYTHPAFTFEGKELEGLWVAKFEAGTIALDKVKEVDEEELDEEIHGDQGNNDKKEEEIIDENIYIKPGVNSVKKLTIGELATRFRKMELNNNIYGFTGGEKLNADLTIESDVNPLDIHMIKNSEWGAVTYLYHSKYGKYGSENYSGNNREIYYNSSTKTGYSTGSYTKEGGNYFYNVKNLGTGASTTGNVYGVYDMNGGKGEMVMTNFQTEYGKFVPVTDSKLNDKINIKYYDVYFANNSNDLNISKLGDAIKETRWYNSIQKISNNQILYRTTPFGINKMELITSTSVGSRPVLIRTISIIETSR